MSQFHDSDDDIVAPQAPDALRLRYAPAPVTQLSRRVLIGASAVGALAIATAVGWGLLAKTDHSGAAEQFSVNPPPPEKITELPRDYTALRPGVPKLGPPLPGDLGRPMLESANSSPRVGQLPTASAPSGEDQVRLAQIQRLAQERDAARTSRLFGAGAAPASNAPALPGVQVSLPPAAPAPELAQGVGTGTGLLDGPVDRRTVSPDRLAPSPSPYALQAGAVIPAALVTGIRSDLPGQVIGQVTQDVYDSVTGKILLIPAGARLIGKYDSQVAFGQNRVLLAWTRLLLPNGRSLVLENPLGADASGFAGVGDRVDHHWRELLGAAAVSSLLGVGTQVASTGDANDLASALRRAGADTANQVGQQIVGKSLSIPPTLTIRPGITVRVILTRDLILEPYRG